MSYIDDLIKSIKEIDSDSLSNDIKSETTNSIIESQSSYYWLRVHLKEDFNKVINSGDIIEVIWEPSGEKLKTTFIAYDKKLSKHDDIIDVVNYQKEEDILSPILMVEESDILDKEDKIPFIRKLFKNYKWFSEEVFRTSDLKFYNLTGDYFLDYVYSDF
jgi:hypothetical protein